MATHDFLKPIRTKADPRPSTLFWSNILAREPLLDVKEAFNVVTKEESYRGLHPDAGSSNKAQPAAFVVKSYKLESAGIQFCYGNRLGLHAFSNAEWAKCLATRKYVSGFCIYFCGNLVL
nr:ribonuclease H-like domain-containing protein [Tanacetum cinerariifolium]